MKPRHHRMRRHTNPRERPNGTREGQRRQRARHRNSPINPSGEATFPTPRAPQLPRRRRRPSRREHGAQHSLPAQITQQLLVSKTATLTSGAQHWHFLFRRSNPKFAPQGATEHGSRPNHSHEGSMRNPDCKTRSSTRKERTRYSQICARVSMNPGLEPAGDQQAIQLASQQNTIIST